MENENSPQLNNLITVKDVASVPKAPPTASSPPTSGMKKARISPLSGVKRKLSIRERQEREEAKRAEKAAKQQKLDEERELREEKKRQLEEEKRVKKEQQEKERQEKLQEKERQKQERDAAKAKKDEENRLKSAEKQKKDEERQKSKEAILRKQEEKRRAEEDEKRRKEKSSVKFLSFFKPLSVDERPSANRSAEKNSKSGFRPFELKPGQRLFPYVRDEVKAEFVVGAFDSSVNGQDVDPCQLYLQLLKHGYKPKHFVTKNHKLLKLPKEEEVVILEDKKDKEVDETEFVKPKMLQFHDNVRPAWFGTWRKKSSFVTARRPTGKDTSYLDYDNDSDEDWDEGGPGESIKDSDSDSESRGEDNYEIDNDVFVPHGYLSGSEGDKEEEDEAGGSMLKERELLATRNRKLKPLKPISIGCIWESDAERYESAYILLKRFKAVLNLPSK